MNAAETRTPAATGDLSKRVAELEAALAEQTRRADAFARTIQAEVDADTTRDRLRFALEAGRLGSWELDVETRDYEASDLCKANYGRRPDERFTFDDLVASIHPDDRERMLKAMEEAIRTGAEYDLEYRILYPSGELHWLHARGRAAQTADHGGVRRLAGVSLDVTERKRSEERQRLLVNELNHRVKNTLAAVQSIAAQTLRTAKDAKQFRLAFESRLMALSQTHDLLTRQGWEATSLSDVLAMELAPHRGDGEARFILKGDREVRLSPKAAVALGMAIHELATNAVKYGALSGDSGKVTVTSQVEHAAGGARLKLVWCETGGPSVAKPERRGFGSRLLEHGLAAELHGRVKLEFNPDGLCCRMMLPMQALEPSG